MSSTPSFSPEILQQPAEFQRFMSGERDLKAIAEMAKHPDRIIVPSKNQLYFSRWSIVWYCCTHPFKLIFFVFLKAIGWLANRFSYSGLSQYTSFLDRHFQFDFDQIFSEQWTFKEKLLVPGRNIPQLSSWDLCNQKPIPRNQVATEILPSFKLKDDVLYYLKKMKTIKLLKLDEKPEVVETILNQIQLKKESSADVLILKLLNEKKDEIFKNKHFIDKIIFRMSLFLDKTSEERIQKIFSDLTSTIKNIISILGKKVHFNSTNGVCSGASTWFSYLVLQSYDLFLDKEKLLIAVAKQLESGVPSQASLLQALDKVGIRRNTRWKYTEEKTIDSTPLLQNASPGIYQITTESHAVVFVNLGGENKQYLFDPNYGLLKLSPSEIKYHILKLYNSEFIKLRPFAKFDD